MSSVADLGERFDNVSEIGRGGFAVVYRARQVAVDRTVAVKVLERVNLNDSEYRRFQRECESMGSLSWHPNIAVIFDAGATGAGEPYLVMEYCEAGSIEDRLRSGNAMGSREVAGVGVQIAEALGAAHAAGIIHRDVKPANILVDGRGTPKLSDFGIAAIRGATQTTAHQILATLEYAPPELLAGQRPTERSDIYSLGATLAAMLLGRAPFTVDSDELLAAVVARILTEPTPELRSAGAHPDLAGAIEQAMAKDPADRFNDAVSFAEALAPAVKPETQATVEAGLSTAPTVILPEGWRSRRGEGDPVSPSQPAPSIARPSANAEARTVGRSAPADLGPGSPNRVRRQGGAASEREPAVTANIVAVLLLALGVTALVVGLLSSGLPLVLASLGLSAAACVVVLVRAFTGSGTESHSSTDHGPPPRRAR